MDRFKLMDTFVRVVRLGSFTATASEIGISRAMVSRHVQELEEHLGIRLFNRSTRQVVLTEAGTGYHEFCRNILAEIAEREQSLAGEQSLARGPLKVVAPKSFGSLHLADAAIAFARAQPGIQLTLVLDDFSFRAYDFVESGLDVAIRLSNLHDAAVMSRKLATLRWVVCAAPAYLAAMAAPTKPADLGRHACLVHVNLDLNDRIWRFRGAGGPVAVKVEGAFLSNSAIVLRKAALEGLGVALLPLYAVGEDIAEGRLVEVLPDYPVPPKPLFALFPHARLLPAKTRIFLDFLSAWFEGGQGGDQTGR